MFRLKLGKNYFGVIFLIRISPTDICITFNKATKMLISENNMNNFVNESVYE